MSATDALREDHDQVSRLEKIISKCAEELYKSTETPLSDIEKITIRISEFVDAIHHSGEEDSYFPCVASYGSLKDEIRLLITNWEPRAEIIDISVYANIDNNGYDVTITFNIINVPDQINVVFFLQRLR